MSTSGDHVTTTSGVAAPDPSVGQSISSDESVQMASPAPASATRPSRDPFLSWELDRAWAPECQDAKRMSTLAGEAREPVWNAKRRHAPCSEKAPKGEGLDCIYLREDHEQQYVLALIAGTIDVDATDLAEVEGSLLFLPKPLLPMKWSPAFQRHHGDPLSEYPQGGDVLLKRDSVPRDSGYAVYAAAVLGGLGVPGRLLREYRREWRHRRRGVLKSWSQTEFYQLPQHARDTLYPKVSKDWGAAEVPARMYVPLPPVVTYRGSALVRDDDLHWTIFRTEWTALVFGRWIADVHFRGLLWRLPQKVRVWVNQLGIATLTQGSSISVTEAQSLLTDHDAVDWTQYEVIVSDSIPEDGIVRVHVAPVLYKKGKVTLEALVRSSIPRFPASAYSSPASASALPRLSVTMTGSRVPPTPVLRSAPPVPEDPYAPRASAMPSQSEPQGLPAGYDPYAPPSASTAYAVAPPASSSLTMPDPYLPAPRVHPPVSSYVAGAHTPGGGTPAAVGSAGDGDHGRSHTDFNRLYNLLAESGHAHMLTRWPDSYGRVGVDSVAAYVYYLDSECRRLASRVRTMEDVCDGLHEQLYDERRERVRWLSGALNDATQRMDEPVRKRRRDAE